jgi:hypothetical protein
MSQSKAVRRHVRLQTSDIAADAMIFRLPWPQVSTVITLMRDSMFKARLAEVYRITKSQLEVSFEQPRLIDHA